MRLLLPRDNNGGPTALDGSTLNSVAVSVVKSLGVAEQGQYWD